MMPILASSGAKSFVEASGNILLSRIMGADVRLVDAGFGIGFKTSWEQALEDVRAAGGTPYAIPAGASDHRLGGLGVRDRQANTDSRS